MTATLQTPGEERRRGRLDGSPLYWLAVLRSARTSGDVLLERLARNRLTALGVRVVFDDPHRAKGGKR